MPRTSPPYIDPGLDVIVRFHDAARIYELDRAIFSLLGQRYRPIRILLVLQRFSAEQSAAVVAALGPLLSLTEGVELVLPEFQATSAPDARAELLNAGLAAALGRYLAILDYDDVILPQAYDRLIERLTIGGAAIAFGCTPVVTSEMHEGFLRAMEIGQPFEGEGLGDLFAANFCPIHSYMMDRERIPPGLLRFEAALTIEEDYEFLLRLCSEVRSDFTLLDVPVGLYFQKDDNSNTFAEATLARPEAVQRMAIAREFVALRRRLCVLSRQVQAELGVDPHRAGMTVQDWLDQRASDLRAAAASLEGDGAVCNDSQPG